MRPIVIVSGVLGGGTALVFALAAVVATAFPTGTLVATSWNGGWGRAMPAVGGGPVWIDDVGGDGDGVIRIMPEEPNVDPQMDIVVPPDITSPDEVVN